MGLGYVRALNAETKGGPTHGYRIQCTVAWNAMARMLYNVCSMAREYSECMVHLKKLDHSALVVRDLEQSSWFYGEVLGLEEVPRPCTFTFGGRWFHGSGYELHLILARDTTAPSGFAEPGEGAPGTRAPPGLRGR